MCGSCMASMNSCWKFGSTVSSMYSTLREHQLASTRFLTIQQGRAATVTGRVAHPSDHLDSTVWKQTHDQRLGAVHVGAESPGDFDPVNLFQRHALDHQFAAGVQGTLGQLDLADIFWVSATISLSMLDSSAQASTNSGCLVPGLMRKRWVILEPFLVEHAAFLDDA